LLKPEHNPKAVENYETYGQNREIEWKPAYCTEEDTMVTDAYGKISFDYRDDLCSRVCFNFFFLIFTHFFNLVYLKFPFTFKVHKSIS
jgi:hypothetical protein